MRSLVRLLPLALLVVLAAVFRDQVAGAVGRMVDLHPVVFAIVPLFWLWNHVAAYSWRGLLQATAPNQPPESAWRLSLLRLQSQAINMAVPALGLGGGAVRIGFTRRAGLAPAASAALLDDLAGGVGGLLFVAFGLALHPGTLLGVPTATVAAVCAAGAGVLWLGIVYGAPALAGRFGEGKPIGRALRVLSQNRSRLAPAFALGVGWHFIERLITAGEIYLAFLALGAGPGLPEAVFVQAGSDRGRDLWGRRAAALLYSGSTGRRRRGHRRRLRRRRSRPTDRAHRGADPPRPPAGGDRRRPRHARIHGAADRTRPAYR